MFQLVDQGILPSEFAHIKSDTPLCNYWTHGKEYRKDWQTHGKKLAIRRDTNNAPGKGTSMDQPVSGQPGLIPQIEGYLTADII